MRDCVLIQVNGTVHEVRGPAAFAPLSDFLRYDNALTGTKIVCEEGDCGACTVLVGRLEEGAMRYRPVNSCIQLLFQLDGCHVITVEAFKQGGRLSPVQEAMVTEHGAQCGFCTPGFVTAMHGLLEERACGFGTGRPVASSPTDEDWRVGLTGNLCRCTGYEPILRACRRIDPRDVVRAAELFPGSPATEMARRALTEGLELQCSRDGQRLSVFMPTTLAEALRLRSAHPDAVVVAGATDLGVQINKRRTDPAKFLGLGLVDELRRLEASGGAIHVGAGVIWSELERLCESAAPEFARVLSVFASPQIKNVGTLVGNVVNASPIADSLPFLFVVDAAVLIASPSGSREVNINHFYQGYKKKDLRPDELVTGIRIPIPAREDSLRLYKVSRRRDLDISAFTAAIRLRRNGVGIAEARVAYGGVAGVVLRLPKTEGSLVGRPFEESTFREAGRLARSEITPISDVRGSAEYRLALAENILVRFYEEER